MRGTYQRAWSDPATGRGRTGKVMGILDGGVSSNVAGGVVVGSVVGSRRSARRCFRIAVLGFVLLVKYGVRGCSLESGAGGFRIGFILGNWIQVG